jgi:hypothetical protein
MWGYIGDTAEEDFIVNEVEGTGRVYLFPHLHFYLGYNKNRIVSAKVTTDVSSALNVFSVTSRSQKAQQVIICNISDGSSCGHYRHQYTHLCSILVLR